MKRETSYISSTLKNMKGTGIPVIIIMNLVPSYKFVITVKLSEAYNVPLKIALMN